MWQHWFWERYYTCFLGVSNPNSYTRQIAYKLIEMGRVPFDLKSKFFRYFVK